MNAAQQKRTISKTTIFAVFAVVVACFALAYFTDRNSPPNANSQGRSAQYIQGEFTEFTESMFQGTLTYFEQEGEVDQRRECHNFEYIGGVWNPPDPEYLCTRGLRTKITLKEPEALEQSIGQATTYLESKDFETYKHIMQPAAACTDKVMRNPTKQCMLSILNPDSKWGHTEKGCTASISTRFSEYDVNSASDGAYLSVSCSIRAAEMPPGYSPGPLNGTQDL